MRVAVTEIRWIEVKKPALRRLAKAEAEHLCVGCMQPLGDETPVRGLHHRCYKATRRGIIAGKWTDADRVEEGKMLEKGDPGRKPTNPISKEAASEDVAR